MRADCVSRELTREIVVGAFMVMIFLGLGYFTIILSREAWFSDRQPLEVVFGHVMGLRENDSVNVRGMPVGKVDTLDIQEDGVHVFVSLDHPVRLNKDYRINIVSTSILGGRYMEIATGSPDQPEVAMDVPLRGTEPYDLMADAAEVVNSVKKALTDGGVIANIEQSVRDLRVMTGRLSSGQGMLGRLLSEDNTLYDDLASTVASLRSIAERAEKGEGSLGRLLSKDDTLYTDLAASASSLKAIMQRAEQGESTLGRLLAKDDSFYQDLASGVASLRAVAERLEKGEGTMGRLLSSDDQLYRDLADSVASLKSIAGSIDRGEGMIGKLVKDDRLYRDVEDMVTELRATIDDFRETAPVTTFTSIFFGAF